MIKWLKSWFAALAPTSRKQESELVPYYDFATKMTVQIPKAELRPGIVLVQIQGQAGAVYADTTQFKQGPYQYSNFSGEIREAMASLVADLADVYPQTLDQWEDGFRRDQSPAREIAGWIHLAAILKLMAERFAFNAAEKKECFRVLVACITGGRETVRPRSDPKLLSDEQINQTIKYFYEGGYR